MKKCLLLVMAAVIATSLVVGCGGVKTYTDPEQTIKVKVNQEFIIALGSNPTTGYDWLVSYDKSVLKLIETKYEAGKEAKEGMIGAGGVKHFRFKALNEGETEVTLTYQRPWEEEILERKVFEVNIK